MVHSVIIGISLGASKNPAIIKPLVAALSFHQFFEGMGLGGCIVQVLQIYNLVQALIYRWPCIETNCMFHDPFKP